MNQPSIFQGFFVSGAKNFLEVFQCQAPQHIDWLSLDVEGAELEILQPLLRSAWDLNKKLKVGRSDTIDYTP